MHGFFVERSSAPENSSLTFVEFLLICHLCKRTRKLMRAGLEEHVVVKTIENEYCIGFRCLNTSASASESLWSLTLLGFPVTEDPVTIVLFRLQNVHRPTTTVGQVTSIRAAACVGQHQHALGGD